MEGDLTWFKFRFRWIKVFKTLSKPEMDRLFDAIEAYSSGSELPDMVGRESVAWAFIESELDADERTRRKAAEAHRNAGANGGRPKTKMVSEETKRTNLVSEVIAENQNNQNTLRVKEIRVKSKEDLKERDIERDAQSANPAPPQKPIKHRYGNFQHVFLTDDEFTRLQSDFPDIQKRIQKLDDYLENNPSKHYANHNLTIRTWANKEAEKQTTQPQKMQNKTAYEMLVERGLV